MMTLIFGPMKSSKSLELLARAEPFKYAGKKVLYVKPFQDVRTDTVKSRLGLEAEALPVESLTQIDEEFDVIAIDEVHMFHSDPTYFTVFRWLRQGKEVIIAGLNLDHAGRLMPTIAKLLEIGPDVIVNKQAVCDKCGEPATHSQVYDGIHPISKAEPSHVPDDGKYKYEARCRLCYI